MFPSDPLPYAKYTQAQQLLWKKFVEKLKSFSESQKSVEDPFIFHGTSLLRARWIMQDGFWSSTENKLHGLFGQVFWTSHIEHALDFAEGRVGISRDHRKKVDDFPAILVARLSDVVASGNPLPDNNYTSGHIDEVETWQKSIFKNGLIKVTSFNPIIPIRVNNLRIISPKWKSLKIHPQAKTDRENRLLDPRALKPPAGMEWMSDGTAESWKDIECLEFGVREPSGKIVFSENKWFSSLMPKHDKIQIESNFKQ